MAVRRHPVRNVGRPLTSKENYEFPVLYLCSISEVGRARSENRRILYRQNEVQETQCSLFPIYRRLPKLDVAGSTPVSRSNIINNLRASGRHSCSLFVLY